MSDFNCMVELLAQGADGAPAIGAPDCPAMSYAALRNLAVDVVATLNGIGVGRGDRVAIVLPNGPEMAAAFVSVAAGAVTAPLNPAYRADEFDFYLDDLGAKALIVAQGDDGAAREVAERRGIEILELVPDGGGPAGGFSLAGIAGELGGHRASGFAGADDLAMILHTSGTTSRPKMVPLSQANICASATHIARTLALTADDRCLNIMPLFHIHGLIAAVLASLAAGAAVHCTPGFNALRFFQWLDAVEPTWYTAVPTMHQAILARAPRNPDSVAGARLRLARSSSSSLPPQVMAELEATFNCPVIEAYGMTEAAHQMASNPLPPGERRPGSVGLAAGPEVAILAVDGGDRLPPGQIGEVAIRGPNVTSGYLENAEANAAAFTDGWFRTGDQGVLDAAGYLTITGRLKEIINRGGEKISPREVDEVLLDHPAVAQAVTFAMPHERLGEEVAAAVVLNAGAEAADAELRDFVGQRLADFKVPRKFLFLDEIPKGATGKLQRIGLAEKLGLG
ncbi:MAG: acyl--CoA ligase [Alphaproteobacteria bacterium]|jgi:acyl-CoA synthetase (AMP-forming)/AMP-acid ligase II|nr:acyl--CoA ligase [Alphaproteobacteria bacterium]MDP6815471.1 acyl--CoA ligase [Alphaproteobacteria bacterium]